MILFFLQVILFTYLISSTFTYTHVVDTAYAENEADHARNTSLAVSIITGMALCLVNLSYYFNYIDVYRMTILFIFVNVVAAILSLVTYVYLQKQRESPPEYDAKLRELNDVAETRNEEAQKFSYWTGLVNIIILGLLSSYLIGHARLTENEFIRIEQPKLFNTKGYTNPTSRGYSPSKNNDIMSRVRHNFIV